MKSTAQRTIFGVVSKGGQEIIHFGKIWHVSLAQKTISVNKSVFTVKIMLQWFIPLKNC